MTGLGRDGFRDLRARLRIGWFWTLRWWVRRQLARAETELGWLGWEQVDIHDEEVAGHARRIQQFEDAQASIQNTSAELSAHQIALKDELAREKALLEQAEISIAAERHPISTQLEETESALRLKLAAVERFDRALRETARLERDLEAQSDDFMSILNPSIEIRAKARQVSDELVRLGSERKLLVTDRSAASAEATALGTDATRIQVELRRIDAAAATARDRLAAATRRLTGEMRLLDREQGKSRLRMSRLDRRKREPYQFIGACLADHGIAPLNQPEILQTVLTLRNREGELTAALATLLADCAAADPALLVSFYLLAAALLFATIVLFTHFLASAIHRGV